MAGTYQFSGGFPFDVDHMQGARGIGLPSLESKKWFTDKKQWEQAVNEINRSKYDDNSEYISYKDTYTVSISGRDWAKWSNSQQRGYIELSSMHAQSVAEGSDKAALKQELDKINQQMRMYLTSWKKNPNDPYSWQHYLNLKQKKEEIIAQLKQGVAEGIAETLPMDDAVKVLRQYGADHFKTTSNELHFYKNGRPFSVDLVMNSDATRNVTLSSLNSATRGLKGQGVAEGSVDSKYPHGEVKYRIVYRKSGEKVEGVNSFARKSDAQQYAAKDPQYSVQAYRVKEGVVEGLPQVAHKMALEKLQRALKNPNVPAEKKAEIAKQIEYQRSQLKQGVAEGSC